MRTGSMQCYRQGAVLAGAALGLALFAMPARAEDVPAKQVFFGDLHLHTRYSNDAFYLTTEEGLDDAYNYAKGKPVTRSNGDVVQMVVPLDFLAVTEHSEFIGALQSFTDPSHPLYDDPQLGALLRSHDSAERFKATAAFEKAAKAGDPPKGYDQKAVTVSVWDAIVKAADRHYAPGRFTTFAAYEWTAYVDGGNMHRNVVFKDTAHLPLPFSALDSDVPEEMWAYLERARGAGAEVLAIPHNSNVSDGRMLTATDSAGRAIDAAYAQRRSVNEPLIEITQSKGTSETHPDLSPEDAFAGYEIWPNLLKGYNKVGRVEGSYVRQGLMLGIDQQRTQGFNPLVFGFVGATDSHTALSSVEEGNLPGFGGAFYDPTPASRRNRTVWNGLPYSAFGVSGLTGVWAEANTREAIFAALQRRETYATTGPRIWVRVFAGWDYAPGLLDKADWAAEAAAAGVPMGGILRGGPERNGAPRLAVWAGKDPNGANLDRVQIIKGWTDENGPHEKIYDVALSDGRSVAADGSAPPVGSTVDVDHATYTNDIGAAMLKVVWADPDFDPRYPAFYYARVLEIPTPRWSTYDAAALAEKLPADTPPWIQERAFTSPVWYDPGR